MNSKFLLSFTFLNQSKSVSVLRHCNNPVFFFLSSAFYFCNSILLIFPLFDFAGFMNLHLGLFSKFGLWSFSVKYASFLASTSILLLNFSFFAMHLAFLCLFMVLRGYSCPLVTLSLSIFWYVCLSISHMLFVLSDFMNILSLSLIFFVSCDSLF